MNIPLSRNGATGITFLRSMWGSGGWYLRIHAEDMRPGR